MIEYYHLFDGIVTSVDPFSDNSLSSLCFSTTDLKNQYLSTKILISTSVCIDLRLVKIFALSLDVDKTKTSIFRKKRLSSRMDRNVYFQIARFRT